MLSLSSVSKPYELSSLKSNKRCHFITLASCFFNLFCFTVTLLFFCFCFVRWLCKSEIFKITHVHKTKNIYGVGVEEMQTFFGEKMQSGSPEVYKCESMQEWTNLSVEVRNCSNKQLWKCTSVESK